MELNCTMHFYESILPKEYILRVIFWYFYFIDIVSYMNSQ